MSHDPTDMSQFEMQLNGVSEEEILANIQKFAVRVGQLQQHLEDNGVSAAVADDLVKCYGQVLIAIG